MKPNHHPDDAIVVAYAAGSTHESYSLVIAAHADGCEQCRVSIDHAEHMGGNLLETLPPVLMNTNGLETVWESIDKPFTAEEQRPLNTREEEFHTLLLRTSGLIWSHWNGVPWFQECSIYLCLDWKAEQAPHDCCVSRRVWTYPSTPMQDRR